jgi:hypothetical protein
MPFLRNITSGLRSLFRKEQVSHEPVLLLSIPVKDPQQLVVFNWSARANPKLQGHSSYGDCADKTGIGDCFFSIPFYKTVRAQAGAFSGMAAFAGCRIPSRIWRRVRRLTLLSPSALIAQPKAISRNELHSETAVRPQSTQNAELISLLLTDVQTRSMFCCVISKRPR